MYDILKEFTDLKAGKIYLGLLRQQTIFGGKLPPATSGACNPRVLLVSYRPVAPFTPALHAALALRLEIIFPVSRNFLSIFTPKSHGSVLWP